MVTDADSFALVAAEALRICHFEPETGEEDRQWAHGDLPGT
jgi:hypothetical protein